MASNEVVQKRSFADLIKTIYFYLFTTIGLILVIVGIFQLSEYAVKKFFLPKYYLGYEENQCDYIRPKMAPPVDMPLPAASPSAAEEQQLIEQEKQCKDRLEENRQYKQVTDIARAITFVLVGSVVFVFHFRRTKLLS